MSWRTHPLVVKARNLGRALGVNRYIASRESGGYEAAYDARMRACIRPGDTVWDVGANVGLYTARFAELVGPAGRVVAFEPSPTNFAELTRACAGLRNVTLEPFGLGERLGVVSFAQGGDSLGATSRIVSGGTEGDTVDIRSGDALIAAGLAVPNVLKIDVEGFEGEVLAGLRQCLSNPDLRAIAIEIHFSLLSERGLAHVPGEIEKTLRQQGLTVSWPDRSHVLATRVSGASA